MKNPIRVLIVDDHVEVRQALAACLNAAPQIEVVGAAGEADEALHQTEALRPDVVIVETKRSDGRGMELIHGLTRGGLAAQVIVLTSYLILWEQWAALSAGAARYLLKDIDCAHLIAQILAVVAVATAALAGLD